MATISLRDMHLFHSMDRALFSRLLTHISRNPTEALLAMAFWLWLNEHRRPHLVMKLLKTPDFVVSKVVDESMICLDSLAENQPVPSIANISFITTILGNHVPFDLMHHDKIATINRIRFFLNRVCARIFTDIIDRVLFNNSAEIPYYERMSVPGFPHPLFGDVTILKFPVDAEFPIDNNIW